MRPAIVLYLLKAMVNHSAWFLLNNDSLSELQFIQAMKLFFQLIQL